MKTVKDWLLELPNPYRSKAIKNHEGYKGMGYVGSMSIALILAFKWSYTPEGNKYWTQVNEMALKGEYTTIINQVKIKKTSAKKVVTLVNGEFKVKYLRPKSEKINKEKKVNEIIQPY